MSSAVVALLVAGSLFVVTVGAVLIVGKQALGSADVDPVETAGRHVQSSSLAELLVRSPGYAGDVDDTCDWVAFTLALTTDTTCSPDAMTRLGLTGGDGLLNYSKFDNLRLAPFLANPADGFVNYQEARAAMGLTDAGLDFHIRAYPSLRGLDDALDGDRYKGLRVAYVGDFERVDDSEGAPAIDAGLVVADLHCAKSPVDAKVLRISASITNGGNVPTQFLAVFDLDFATGNDTRVQSPTFLVGASLERDVWVDVPATTGRSCTGLSSIELEIHDPDVKLREQTLTSWTNGDAPTSTTRELELVQPHSYWYDDEAITLDYDEVPKTHLLRLRIRQGPELTDGLVYGPIDHSVPSSNNQQKITIPVNTLLPGEFFVFLEHVASGTTITQRLLVLEGDPEAAPPGLYTPDDSSFAYQYADLVKKEVEYLDLLVHDFCPFIYNDQTDTPVEGRDHRYYHGDPGDPDATPPTPPIPARCDPRRASALADHPGDVYPDLREDLRDELARRLVDADSCPHCVGRTDDINVLIIGSKADHQPLVHLKSEIAAWVEAGGYLIVLGSEDTNTQWMQDIFHLGIHSSSGGVSFLDENHPVLHAPEELAYQDYDHDQRIWKFTGQAADDFTTIATAGASDQAPSNLILGVSDPGAFGKGTVTVSSWFPYDLFNTGLGTADVEGLRFTTNLLLLGYRTLYLDYGPPIPPGLEVVPGTARSSIQAPDVGLVTMDIVVYVFQGV